MVFEDWLQTVIDTSVGESAEDVCEALAPILTDGDRARLWLGERLAGFVHDPPDLPAGYADPVCQSLVMLDYRNVHLSLAIISADGWNAQRDARRENPDIIGFADGWTAIRFLVAPDATIQRHVLDRTDDGWRAFAQAPEVVATDRVLRFSNAREATRLVHVGADVIMARLLVRDPGEEVAYECDARTGAVLRVRQAQSHLGRTQMIVSLLRSLGRRDAVPVIAEAMADWPAHLRWHGAREALAMDSLAGFKLLEALAARDPDLQLRALARQTRDDLIARYPELAA